MFYKIDVLKTFAKFTGKLLRCRLLVNKVLGWRPATLLKKRRQHRSFPVNFAKLLTTPSLPNTAGQLFLNNGKMITARQFVLPKGSALRWILPIIYTVGKWLVNTFWLIFWSYFGHTLKCQTAHTPVKDPLVYIVPLTAWRVRIQRYSGLHFPAFGLNTERYGVSLRVQSE